MPHFNVPLFAIFRGKLGEMGLENKMNQFVRRAAIVAGTVALALGLSGCGQIRGHQGYIVDPVLMDAVQAGVDNKESVEATLGRPSFVGQFDKNDWFYVSRTIKQLAFRNPRPTEQLVTRVRFDNAGNVIAVDRTGVELAVNLTPNGDKTPTLGRDRGFFEELFGNIGTVGSGLPGGSGGGAGRTQP